MSRIKNLIEGLCMIAEKDEKAEFDFQHDTMYIGDISKFNEEDIKKLNSLGFMVSEGDECFETY